MAKAKSTIEPTSTEPPFATLAAAVSPQWGDTILRLTQATNRLSRRVDQFVGATTRVDTVKACRELTQELINFLDEIGGDTDQDSAVDDEACCDDELDDNEEDFEPSLGSSGHASGGAISYTSPAISDGCEIVYDCEGDEHDGREPDDEDDTHDGREPDREDSPGFGEGMVDQTVNPPYGGGDGIGGVL
jgi:hypothetical protein